MKTKLERPEKPCDLPEDNKENHEKPLAGKSVPSRILRHKRYHKAKLVRTPSFILNIMLSELAWSIKQV
jgi:hypothetical protein